MSAPDGVEIIVNVLLADTAVKALIGDKVYGGIVPPNAVPPLILVRSIARRPVTNPTTQWWEIATAVDCQSEDPSGSFQLACAAEDAINGIVGAQTGSVVQASRVTGISSIEDGAFTPTRFRNVATAEITARKP
ncbi:MAG: tail completion protein gp17 [Ilumatobacteraceae bacterium]